MWTWSNLQFSNLQNLLWGKKIDEKLMLSKSSLTCSFQSIWIMENQDKTFTKKLIKSQWSKRTQLIHPNSRMKFFKGPNPKSACLYKEPKCSLQSKELLIKSTKIHRKKSNAFQSNLMKLQIYSLLKLKLTKNLPRNRYFQVNKQNLHQSIDKYWSAHFTKNTWIFTKV